MATPQRRLSTTHRVEVRLMMFFKRGIFFGVLSVAAITANLQ